MLLLARLAAALGICAVLGLIGWAALAARPLDASALAGLGPGDATSGERIYHAAGCASCHSAPGAADKNILSGGQRFPSEFGTFVAPNISPDTDAGIGGWNLLEFASALNRGVSPEGQHYYPAFPYTAYTMMEMQDVADLKAFMDTLPPSDRASEPNELGFPFNIRRGLGLWKALYLRHEWHLKDADTAELEEGRYLSEALAHCGECHTPRTALGGLDGARWMAGAPNPSGRGRIPGLTPAQLNWSAGDIAYYLETGFTPEFDSVGGHMAAVVANFAQLSPEDRAAVAAYVKVLPPAE